MKFELTENTPQIITRSLVGINKKSGLRERVNKVFTKGEVYDTADFEEQFPEFAKSVLDIKQQIANANNTTVSELRAIYGDKLTVNRCSACGGAKATVLFPIFKEI